jgi:hypothetical protein
MLIVNPNRSHVATAEEALKSVYDAVDEEAIRDMLCDLRHLCDSKRLDFARIDRRAYRTYADEMAGAP